MTALLYIQNFGKPIVQVDLEEIGGAMLEFANGLVIIVNDDYEVIRVLKTLTKEEAAEINLNT